ncbi:MAG: pyridoxamine 5'-phosphate oxidase family protein [Candidatus Levybacteria bacterium]|nr:pyridoxamine 5'-phosphate oxidase family protein [Candidatus Levybacteria bacterium]
MKESKFDWRKYIEEALSATEYCSLATVDEKGVWSNPVYFAWDEKYNLYFISQMHSRHMQNIKRNNRIAVSIYKTEQKGDVLGIQLEGRAEILTGKKEAMKKAFDIYFARAGKGKDQEEYMTNPTWHFVKITPEHIYYFDTNFFEEERQEVPLQELIN